MTYRDDLEAALARADSLQREVDELRAQKHLLTFFTARFGAFFTGWSSHAVISHSVCSTDSPAR